MTENNFVRYERPGDREARVTVPRSLLTAALVDAGQVQAYLGLLPIQGVPGSESMCDVADRLVKRLTVALGGEEGADGKK